jgi:cytochrome c5
MKRCIFLALALSLPACGSKQTTMPDTKAIERAATLLPADSRLAMLYTQSCKLCHAIAGSVAPLTGDRSAWESRWEKGLSALTQNVIVGLNGMPPGGQCFACSAEDYTALIKFMADRQ